MISGAIPAKLRRNHFRSQKIPRNSVSAEFRGHPITKATGACMCGPGLNACKHLMDRQSNCSTGKINPCENVFLENDVYERET